MNLELTNADSKQLETQNWQNISSKLKYIEKFIFKS